MSDNENEGEFLKGVNDFMDAMRTRDINVRTMRALFAGKIDEAKAVCRASEVFVDTIAEAMQEGSTPKMAADRFRMETEDTRRDLAGLFNTFVGFGEQVRNQLAKVGSELGDKHVETVNMGCGDPDCPNCNPDKAVEKMLAEGVDFTSVGEEIARALGIDPSEMQVEIASGKSEEEAMAKFKAGQGIKVPAKEDSVPRDVKIDDHTKDIQKSIAHMLTPDKRKKPPVS